MGGGEGIPPPPFAQPVAIPPASSKPVSTRRAMRINGPPQGPYAAAYAAQRATSRAAAPRRSAFPHRPADGAFGAGAATDQWALRHFQRPSRRGSQPPDASAAVIRIAATPRTRSPAIAQLAQLHEHGARIGTLADVGKRFPQPRYDRGILQPEERVDALLLSERGHQRRGRVVMARLPEQLRRVLVGGLAIERELEVARQVLVAGEHARLVRQARELCDEAVVQLLRVPAVETVAGAGVEQRVAAEQRRLLRARQQADVRERVPGRVQAFELHGAPDLDDV